MPHRPNRRARRAWLPCLLLLACTATLAQEITVTAAQQKALGVTIALPSEDKFLATRQECVERMTMIMAGRLMIPPSGPPGAWVAQCGRWMPAISSSLLK